MKKIININLSGRVIPIEDAAYEKLQEYIDSLRRYFAKEEGRDEIINDIESRIAELLHDKIRKGAANATDTDVDEIIASMGKVADFEAADATDASGPTGQSAEPNFSWKQERQSKGRLYRDSSDRFIGGVCSGIAAYMNVDPAIVRILFAIITFGGFGLGFLAYILLWIILPPKDLDGYFGKRLYRNPDDRIIGGVAGGLGAYFGKSTKTIRLIFAAPLILSIIVSILKGIAWDFEFNMAMNIGFGSLTGTFILIYIVLWMVLPEANTTYEKMEMRGEKVDVNRIRQNVQEGMGNVKERMKGWGEEVKESAKNFGNRAREFSDTRGKAFASEVNQTVRSGGRGIGHAIGVLFKVFFLFIAGTIALSLFITLIALFVGGVAWWPLTDFFWTSKAQQFYAWGTVIFFLIVPLLAFIIWLIRRIIRVKSRSNYLGWTFGGLWTIGWIAGVLFVSSIARDFREHEHIPVPIQVSQPSNGKMIVAVSEPELQYTGRFDWINDDATGWDLTNDSLKLSSIEFEVKASPDSLYYVTLNKYSFGRTEEDALNRSDKISYHATSMDSVLYLANGYAIGKENKFRMQHVEVEILVPVGRKLRFDESVNDKLNPVNVRVERSRRRNRVRGVTINDNSSSRYRAGIDYTMGINGSLKADDDLSVRTAPGTEYRYPGGARDSQLENDEQIQQRIDIERKKKEESDRIIRELEEARRKKQTTVLKSVRGAKNIEKAIVREPSPASMILQWF